MTALHQPLGLLLNDGCYAHMPLCRLIEGGCNNLCIHIAGHLGDLLGTLVYQQDHEIDLRVEFGNGIGNILQEYGLAGLWLRHDKTALSLPYGAEHVHDAY